MRPGPRRGGPQSPPKRPRDGPRSGQRHLDIGIAAVAPARVSAALVIARATAAAPTALRAAVAAPARFAVEAVARRMACLGRRQRRSHGGRVTGLRSGHGRIEMPLIRVDHAHRGPTTPPAGIASSGRHGGQPCGRVALCAPEILELDDQSPQFSSHEDKNPPCASASRGRYL